jgi:hypothetical protein
MNDLGGRETLIRVRATEVVPGKFGDPGTAGEPDLLMIEGCVVYPRRATEAEGRESTTIVGMTALAPDPAADILASDRIQWRGDLYEIDGVPGPWRFLDSEDAGLELALKLAAN